MNAAISNTGLEDIHELYDYCTWKFVSSTTGRCEEGRIANVKDDLSGTIFEVH